MRLKVRTSKSDRREISFHLCHFLVVWPRSGSFLRLSFLIFKMEGMKVLMCGLQGKHSTHWLAHGGGPRSSCSCYHCYFLLKGEEIPHHSFSARACYAYLCLTPFNCLISVFYPFPSLTPLQCQRKPTTETHFYKCFSNNGDMLAFRIILLDFPFH